MNSLAASTAVFSPLDYYPGDLGVLVNCKLRAASADASFPAGGLQTRLRSFAQHGALESSESPDHLYHDPPAGVVVSIASVRLRKAGFGLTQPFHDGQDIAQRPGEPVELP